MHYDRMLRFEPCANVKTGEELEELLRLHRVSPRVKLYTEQKLWSKDPERMTPAELFGELDGNWITLAVFGEGKAMLLVPESKDRLFFVPNCKSARGHKRVC